MKQKCFWHSLTFSMIQWMLAIWSLVPLPLPLPNLSICKFSIHIPLKPGLKAFEHNLHSMGNECNCMVIWISFGIAFLWDWNENWPFPVLWLLLSFPNLLTYCVQHYLHQWWRGIEEFFNDFDYLLPENKSILGIIHSIVDDIQE